MERKLLMIPGPISFDPEVLRAQARPALSHVDPEFIAIFGRALDNLNRVFLSAHGQPFVLAGSGTLAMEFVAANFLEQGDRVIVVDTGWFSQRYTDVAQRYTSNVEVVSGEVGALPPLDKVEAALKAAPTKLVTITHVDTSTGVQAPVRELAALARKHGALSVVDGICATAACEFRQDDWQVDVCITGSQKAIGVPPGLALMMVSQAAMARFEERKTPAGSYYCDIKNWLPVMRAYQEGRAAYFATPPVNLIYALDVSLQQVVAEGMEPRFERHAKLGEAFRAGMQGLGIKLLAQRGLEAPTISAMYYPEGVDAALVGKVGAQGVTIAGGVYPGLAPKYFRVGHMGTCTPSDVLATVGAIERGLLEIGAKVQLGAGVAAAQQVLSD